MDFCRPRQSLGILFTILFGFSHPVEAQTSQAGILESGDGVPLANAPFHIFGYDGKTPGLVERASGKTGKDGGFSYPIETAQTEMPLTKYLFADLPDGARFVAALQPTKSGPLTVKAWGPWADLVVTFTAPGGTPANGLHGRVTKLYDASENGFFTEVPPLPAGTWDATTDAQGRLVIPKQPTQCRFYVELDDVRYAQLFGLHSSRKWFVPGKPQSVELIPPGSISGRVTFPDGSPAKDVPVRVLEQYHYEAAGGGGGETQTDAEGRFSIGRLRPATYDVEASLAPGLAAQWAAPLRTGIKLSQGENAAHLDIQLTKGATVTGTVTSSRTGKPIAEPRLTIGLVPTDQSSPLGQLWATTTEGRYRARIPAGPHRVYVGSSAPGYEEKNDKPSEINARDGEEVSVDFQLEPKEEQFRVTGIVLDTNGKPAAGISVRIPAAFPHEASGTTDADGKFAIEVAKEIKDRAPIFAADGPKRSSLQKAASGKDITLVLEDKSLATIRGRVVDGLGKPIPDATVAFALPWEAGNWQNPLTTDGEGRFEFPHAWSDVRFEVRCQAEDFGSTSTQVSAARGEKLDMGDLVLAKADQVVEGNVVDPDGNPVSVDLSVRGRNQPSIHGESDSTGRFRLTGLVRGKVTLTAHQKIGGNFVTVAGVSAHAGDSEIKLTVKRANATLLGCLVDAGKQPLSGATVAADDIDQPGSVSAVTGKDGTFRLSGLFPGWLTVKVISPGNSRDGVTLRAKADGNEHLLVLPEQPTATADPTPAPSEDLAKLGSIGPKIEAALWINSPALPPQNQGTVRILDFWNIFCGPCIANLPKQQKFWEAHHGDGLEMIALHSAWNEAEVREFLAARPGIRFPIAIEKDGSPVFCRYDVQAVPTYVVIGPDGKIEFIGAGDWEGAQARALSILETLPKKHSKSP